MESTTHSIGSRRTHHLSPWFHVTEVELHVEGEVSTWHFQDHPGAAIVVPITPDGSILVSSEYRVSVDAVVLEVPGGRIDPGETPEQAGMREMFEEIGATADEVHFLGRVLNSPGSSNEETHVFAARSARVVEARPGTVEVTPEALIASARAHTPTDALTLTAVLLARAANLLDRASALPGAADDQLPSPVRS